MALHNDPRLYSGGIVEFDTTPTVNAYRQIEAERRAKQDAIDDYMKGLRSKITPAGMAANDIDAFDFMRRQWQDFGIANREKIARDPKLRAEFDAKAQDLISFVERSKAKMDAGKPFIGMLSNRANAEKIRKEAMEMYDRHMMPLMKKTDSGFDWDYDRKDIDYTSKIFEEPKFDFQKEYKGWVGEMKPGEMVELDKPVTDKQTGLVYYPAKEKFNKEQIAQVGRNAVRSIADDEDKLDYYANRLASIGQKEYQNLDNIYKKYFNDNIGKSPEKLAAAEAALAAEQFVGKETMKSKLDYERRQEDKRINISLNQGAGGTSPVVNDVYKVVDDAATNIKNAGKPYLQVNLLPVDAQGLVLDFVEKLTNKPVDQSKIKIIKGDDGRVGIYWANNGRFIGFLPRVGTNLKVQPDVKAKRAVVGEGEPIKKSGTFLFPNGKTKF